VLKFIFVLLFCFSCTNKNKTTIKNDKKIDNGVVKKIDRKKMYFGEKSGYLKGSKKIVSDLNIGWTLKSSFPKYSKSLSLLAKAASIFDGKTVSSSSLLNLTPHYGIYTPWIVQSCSKDDGFIKYEYYIEWILKGLSKYKKSHGITHFGFYINNGVFVLFMQKRLIKLKPFANWYNPGEKIKISGKTVKEIKSIEVLITDPQNKVSTFGGIKLKNQKFKTSLKICKNKKNLGLYHVELMGHDANGPTVLALFIVACGAKHWPETTRLKLRGKPVNMKEIEFAQKVFTAINKYRSSLKLNLLLFHKTLSKVSESHSIEMCQTLKLMHISKTTGKPMDRVKKYGLEPVLLGENVAVAENPQEIINGWITSEGHRLNLKLQKATHGGVGVCKYKMSSGSFIYYVTLLIVKF
jgi:Cysteine-rich secretory protein family